MPSTPLQCPTCGGQRFGYTIEQVHWGGAHEFESGHRNVESFKSGPITGSDVDDDGVMCTECTGEFQLDELERVDTDEVDTE